jgi:opacity protein-like surface antigen
MNKTITLALTLMAASYIPTVSAIEKNDWYLGALYSSQDISINGREYSTVGGIIGYQYNEYISLEARGSFGVSGYSEVFIDIDREALKGGVYKLAPSGFVEHDIDTQVAFFIKASYPIANDFNIYALAGVSVTQSTLKGLARRFSADGSYEDVAFNDSFTDNGFSYGLGGNYQLSQNVSFFIDYQILPEFEPYSHLSSFYSKAKDWSNINIGVNYFF